MNCAKAAAGENLGEAEFGIAWSSEGEHEEGDPVETDREQQLEFEGKELHSEADGPESRDTHLLSFAVGKIAKHARRIVRASTGVVDGEHLATSTEHLSFKKYAWKLDGDYEQTKSEGIGHERFREAAGGEG